MVMPLCVLRSNSCSNVFKFERLKGQVERNFNVNSSQRDKREPILCEVDCIKTKTTNSYITLIQNTMFSEHYNKGKYVLVR